MNFARGATGAALGLLFATGLFLGLGLGGGLSAYASADPGAVWQSAAATALFVGALGALGYGIQADLSGGYRVLFLLLLALIVYGLITLFVSMPAGNVIYAVLGLGIFGGLHRRSTSTACAGPTAAMLPQSRWGSSSTSSTYSRSSFSCSGAGRTDLGQAGAGRLVDASLESGMLWCATSAATTRIEDSASDPRP